MVNKHFSQEQIDFFKKLKNSLNKENGVVFGSTTRTTDLVFLNWKKDIQLYKIVIPEETKNIKIWIEKLKKIYTLAWFKAEYNLVFVDKNFNEIKREIHFLN